MPVRRSVRHAVPRAYVRTYVRIYFEVCIYVLMYVGMQPYILHNVVRKKQNVHHAEQKTNEIEDISPNFTGNVFFIAHEAL